MIGSEYTLATLLLVLSLGLIIPEFFRKNKFPFAVFLIIFGAILGPNGMGYIQTDSTIEFFGFLGSMFLMFMAGLEVKLEALQRSGHDVILMAFANGIIPFSTGAVITLMFGYSFVEALLVGIVMISSSVAIVSVSINAAGLNRRKIGKKIISATVLQDTFSLLVLSFLFQSLFKRTTLHPLTYLAVLVVSIAALKVFVPQIAGHYLSKEKKKGDTQERELRFAIAILLLFAMYFSSIGVHSIVASFLLGILLSDVIASDFLHQKFHTIGYGLFIPVFFFVVGMELDVQSLITFHYTNLFAVALIVGLVVSKILSGYLSGRIVGFSDKDAKIFGVLSIVQLTTSLSVTYAAASLDILSGVLVNSILLLSIVTTILSPILLGFALGGD